jgi:hypothetical protein
MHRHLNSAGNSIRTIWSGLLIYRYGVFIMSRRNPNTPRTPREDAAATIENSTEAALSETQTTFLLPLPRSAPKNRATPAAPANSPSIMPLSPPLLSLDTNDSPVEFEVFALGMEYPREIPRTPEHAELSRRVDRLHQQKKKTAAIQKNLITTFVAKLALKFVQRIAPNSTVLNIMLENEHYQKYQELLVRRFLKYFRQLDTPTFTIHALNALEHTLFAQIHSGSLGSHRQDIIAACRLWGEQYQPPEATSEPPVCLQSGFNF